MACQGRADGTPCKRCAVFRVEFCLNEISKGEIYSVNGVGAMS